MFTCSGAHRYRRDFLCAASALVAGTFLPQSADAAPRPKAPASAIDAWLAELDIDLDRMRRPRPIGPIRRRLQAAGLHPQLIGESRAALALAAEWEDSSEAVRQHPAFVARMLQSAEQLGAHMLALTQWMRSGSRAQRRQQNRVLRSPARSAGVLGATAAPEHRDLADGSEARLRKQARLATRALRNQGDADLVDALIAEVDRAEQETRAGTDPELDAAILQALSPLSPEDGSQGDEPQDNRPYAVRVGLRLLRLGGIGLGSGIVLVLVGSLIPGVPIGVLLIPPLFILVSLFLLIAGIVLLVIGVNESIDREAAQDASMNVDTEKGRYLALLDCVGPPGPIDLQPA